MKNKVLFILLIFVNYHLVGQVNTSQINGDFNLSMQSYQEDLVIGAQAAEEIVLNNAFLNINYSKGNFLAGIRYESYLNALADFDPEFKGMEYLLNTQHILFMV